MARIYDGKLILEDGSEYFGYRFGAADERTVKVLSHFSHNGGQTHDEMCAVAEKEGYIVAYDGMEVSF